MGRLAALVGLLRFVHLIDRLATVGHRRAQIWNGKGVGIERNAWDRPSSSAFTSYHISSSFRLYRDHPQLGKGRAVMPAPLTRFADLVLG